MLNKSIPQNRLSATTATENPHSIIVSNHTDKPFLEWVPTTCFFKRGEMFASDLDSFGPKERPYAWKVCRLWGDGSVRSAQIRTPFYFAAQGVQYAPLEKGQSPLKHFVFHETLKAKLVDLIHQFKVEVRCNGEDLVALPLLGHAKLLEGSAVGIQARYRSHFYTKSFPAEKRALSCTVYVEVYSFSPVVRFTLVVGNDTLEMPIAGGVQVSNLSVEPMKDQDVKFYHAESYGSFNFELADGQTMAIRGAFSVDSYQLHRDSAEVLSHSIMVGTDNYESVRLSEALGDQSLPVSRVPNAQILQAHNQVNSAMWFPNAEAKSNIGHINLNPPSTGDQPDFGSTLPYDLQRAMMAYSTKALSRVYLSVLRESFRPSFYWETRNGVVERCEAVNYPNLFFWSGRPHWHPSWNPEYPAWQQRGTLAAGHFGGWGSSDNQHLSNMHLRYLAELTQDPYLLEVCHYYVSLNYWNFFTKWLPNHEAERCARIMKDSQSLASMFSHDPNGILLNQKFAIKYQSLKDAVTANVTRFGIAGHAPFDACDPRVMNGRNCPVSGPKDIVCVAWQCGFHMELEAMQDLGDLRYLADVDKYFLPDGTPKTYFLFTDPHNYDVGGIGITWWSGWIQLALKHPTAPGASFIIEKVKPLIDAEFTPPSGQYFHPNDRWRAW